MFPSFSFAVSVAADMTLYFNPRSHERSDTDLENRIAGHIKFQSTLPREERLTFVPLIVANCIFQSTLPREERPSSAPALKDGTWNFNPRSHERSDAYRRHILRHCAISIHAPTRGATGESDVNHCVNSYFNPRSHERSDCRAHQPRSSEV